jgi:hypothetical protein
LEKRLKYLATYIQKNQLQDKVSVVFVCMGMLYNLFEYAKLEKLYYDIIIANKIKHFNFTMDPNLTGFFKRNKHGKEEHYHVLNLKYAPTMLIAEALDRYRDYKDRPWYNKLRYIYDNKQDTRYQRIIKEHTMILDEAYKQDYREHLHPSIVNFLNQ